MAFAFLNRIFRGSDPKDEWRPLYAAIVNVARKPHWYSVGAVPDTLDGRFEMVTLIASLVWIRMEELGDAGNQGSVHLTEVLIEDLEAQIREIGFGDQVVGKRMGEMMGAVGGRLGAYRDGLTAGNLEDAAIRNLYRAAEPAGPALAHVVAEVRNLHLKLGLYSVADLKNGAIDQ